MRQQVLRHLKVTLMTLVPPRLSSTRKSAWCSASVMLAKDAMLLLSILMIGAHYCASLQTACARSSCVCLKRHWEHEAKGVKLTLTASKLNLPLDSWDPNAEHASRTYNTISKCCYTDVILTMVKISCVSSQSHWLALQRQPREQSIFLGCKQNFLPAMQLLLRVSYRAARPQSIHKLMLTTNPLGAQLAPEIVSLSWLPDWHTHTLSMAHRKPCVLHLSKCRRQTCCRPGGKNCWPKKISSSPCLPQDVQDAENAILLVKFDLANNRDPHEDSFLASCDNVEQAIADLTSRSKDTVESAPPTTLPPLAPPGPSVDGNALPGNFDDISLPGLTSDEWTVLSVSWKLTSWATAVLYSRSNRCQGGLEFQHDCQPFRALSWAFAQQHTAASIHWFINLRWRNLESGVALSNTKYDSDEIISSFETIS